MVVCSVKGCTNRSSRKSTNQQNKEKNKRLSFHRFPEDAKLRTAWIDAVKRTDWNPTIFSTICSDHFEANCFDESPFYRKLKKTAIPTLFPVNFYLIPLIPAENVPETPSNITEEGSPTFEIVVKSEPVEPAPEPEVVTQFVSRSTSLSPDRERSCSCGPPKTVIIKNYELKLKKCRKKIRCLQQKNRRNVRKMEKLNIALAKLKSKDC